MPPLYLFVRVSIISYHTLQIIRTYSIEVCIIINNYTNVKTIKEKWFRLELSIYPISKVTEIIFHDMMFDFTTIYILLFSSELAHFLVMYFCFLNDCFQCILLSTYLHNISILVCVMTYDLWYYGWVISSLSTVFELTML